MDLREIAKEAADKIIAWDCPTGPTEDALKRIILHALETTTARQQQEHEQWGLALIAERDKLKAELVECQTSRRNSYWEEFKARKAAEAENDQLKAELEQARKDVERGRAAILWLEGLFKLSLGGGQHHCPWCYKRVNIDDGLPWSQIEHSPDCVIGAALTARQARQAGQKEKV